MLLLDEPTNHLDLEMRHALVMALQGFEGAMVTVSHDRHMLKNTADEYYLVDQGQVTPFGYDLDAYYQWLLAANKADNVVEDKADKTHSAVNRKDQKRREAEFRQAVQPLKKKITQLETKLDKVTAQLQEVENALADNSLYDAQNKAILTELLAKQAKLVPEQNDLEELLLELLEELEQHENEFNAQLD